MMMEELLLWEDLVSVACKGVMKLDWWCWGLVGGVWEDREGLGVWEEHDITGGP